MFARGARRVALALALAALGACESREQQEDGLVRDARFGVFYGGQVQQRDEIPFNADPTKQTLGFRVDFNQALKQPLEVAWEIDMPRGNARRDARGRVVHERVAKVQRASARAGLERLEQVVPIEPGYPTGLYNVRVVVGEHLVIDRAVLLYDPAERRRSERDGG